jgi:aminoglycoside phosphotransferase (APT) family kinase protein
MANNTPAQQDETQIMGALIGIPVVALERCVMGFENHTDLVTLADGRRVIVQRISNRGLAAHKIRLARLLPERLAQAGIRAPQLIAADASSESPFAVREYVEGQAGNALLADQHEAIQLAHAMGALLPRLALVQTNDLGLHTGWASPQRIASQARRQLGRRRGMIGEKHQAMLKATIDQVETLFVERKACFAHGDFCPVNALVTVDNQQTTGNKLARFEVVLIDLEFARIADPLFDAAWWGWVVRYHHEERWRQAWPHLLAAAGIAGDAMTQAQITVIQQLRLLEALDYNAALSAERGEAWAARLATTLEWE